MMKTRHSIPFALIILVATVRIATAGPVTVAHDTADNSAYLDGWDNGDNGGQGFGAWALSFDGDVGQLDPVYGGNSHFIDGGNVGPMPANGIGQRSFGVTTSRQLHMAAAERKFGSPLTVGRSFSMSIDGSAFEIGQFLGIGNKIQLLGADGVPRYELVSTDPANNSEWMANGSPTSIPYDEPIQFSFSPRSVDTYAATITGTSVAHASFGRALMGTPGMPIAGIRVENIGTGSSNDGATELFFDDLKIVEYVPEPGAATLSIWGLLTFVGWFRR